MSPPGCWQLPQASPPTRIWWRQTCSTISGDDGVEGVAADVLCYLGDLTELFEQAHRVCRAGGIFGFSVENDPLATADYGLRSTGRFAHSAGYIRALAQRFGFAEREANPVTVRFENGSPVTGLVFLLVKPS